MAGINDLFGEIKKIKDELRSLRGKIANIAVGTQIITPNIPGTAAVPPPLEGAMIVGNATPAWERLAHPVPILGQKFGLTFNFGDTKPMWRGAQGQYRQFVYEVSGGSFTFITDIDGNPIFTLLDLE